MRRCLELASRGLGSVAPNPMVGSVVVYKGRIIGEGFHRQFGGPHAEVMAIQSVQDQSLLADSVLYVNLEPCSHYGKTPPCTELIASRYIPFIVTGTADPNPLVSGKGIQFLREQGMKVVTDILKAECEHLNRRFFTFHIRKRPYIILKWAQTSDGFMDVDKKEKRTKGITWITDEVSRRMVHKWRTEEQSILVGSGTVIADNPRLTARNWPGGSPVRLVIDREGKLSGDLHILDGTVKTFIFTYSAAKTQDNVTYVQPDRNKDMVMALLEFLLTKNIQSVMVEGGKILLDEFIRQGCWDEARVFTGNCSFGKGVPAPAINMEAIEQLRFSDSILKIFRNEQGAC